MSDLFSAAGLEAAAPGAPLAERLRPKRLADVIGQDHLLKDDAPLGRMIKGRRLSSLVFWGPPGTGKTTIARLLARAVGLDFEAVSAIHAGVADLRAVFERAAQRRRTGRGTLLFVDEVHRFNRAQQDSFLPHLEDGTVVFVGATTENPSFELNGALLSRAQVLVLRRLDASALETLLTRAETAKGRALPLDAAAREALTAMADGDGRFLLNLAEDLFDLPPTERLDPAGLAAAVQRRAPLYDKSREGHYNLISALHKSIRGSDPDAALYWLARMLAGGEDRLFIARRLVRAAYEDIGLADPEAAHQALAAKEAFDFLGSPEGEIALFQATLYLATAPKSNAVYTAEKGSRGLAAEHGSLDPPKHILNAPTRLMKDLGYGAGYQYDHGTADGFSGQNYFPDSLPRTELYAPSGRGHEAEIAKRLAQWAALRAAKAKG